ncbi:MAG: hypothetical protein ACOY71_08350 [Gemmatimonadota bacterium]
MNGSRYGWLIALGLVLALGPAARAQEPVSPESPRAHQLRQQIQERFAERVKEQLGLSDEQAAKLQATTSSFAVKRRQLERQAREVRQALGRQLRPGVAANPDSMTRYVDQLTALRVAYAQTFDEELKEIGKFLSPVQRGQYFLAQEQLLNRVRELMRSAPPNRPGRALNQPR